MVFSCCCFLSYFSYVLICIYYINTPVLQHSNLLHSISISIFKSKRQNRNHLRFRLLLLFPSSSCCSLLFTNFILIQFLLFFINSPKTSISLFLYINIFFYFLLILVRIYFILFLLVYL